MITSKLVLKRIFLAFFIIASLAVIFTNLPINKQNLQQREEVQEEAPQSVYDVMKRKCNFDTKGYGECDYDVDFYVRFTIKWDPKGKSLMMSDAGNSDGLYYVDFNNIELTLIKTENRYFDLGYEFYFETSCIPVQAGEKLMKKYSEYRKKNPELFFFPEEGAFVSPVTGEIYQSNYECQLDIPAK
jgi:hypothetical protein